MKVVILNYGLGNVWSVQKAFKKIGVEATIGASADLIENADKLILPGVGHFGTAMEFLKDKQLIEPLNKQVLEHKKPILGICLGMQLLCSRSDEGNVDGLNWISANVKPLDATNNIKIPQIGWNTVEPTRTHPILTDINQSDEFYFVHAYHVECEHPEDALSNTRYGSSFHSIIQRENIVGIQCHPEKSYESGEKFLTNFLNL